MVSVPFKQGRLRVYVSFAMVLIAVVFILGMVVSLVHSTRMFWETF